MKSLNALKQAKADNDKAQATLKAEGRKLLNMAARTPEQDARLTALEGELDALVDEAATIATDLARAERFQADEILEGAALALAARIIPGADHEAEKPVSLGEFLQGLAYMSLPGKRDLIAKNVLAELYAATGASSGVSADGGALVRSEWNTSLLAKIQESSQLLPKCDQLPVGDGFDGIEAPYINETSRATGSRWGGVQVYRAAEAASVTATKPGIGKFELRLEDMKGLFYATDRVLRDSVLLEAIANKAFSSEFAFKLDDEIVRGTGTGQCLGILNADATVSQAKEVAQTANTVKAENVIKMYNRLLSRNIAGAQWYINQEILPQLWTMAIAVGTAGGQLVYMPPGGLSTSPYGTLLGRPVNVLEQAAGLGTVGDIIFADFSEYLVISKSMTSASSMHVRFINDEMTFRWTWPVIGKPKLASPITPYKATTATTLSPFVTLATRA